MSTKNRALVAATLACFAVGATLATVSLAPAHPRATVLMVPETVITGAYVAPEPVFEPSVVTLVVPKAPVAHVAQHHTPKASAPAPFCMQVIGDPNSCIAGASPRGSQTYTGETPRLGDFSRGHVVGGGR